MAGTWTTVAGTAYAAHTHVESRALGHFTHYTGEDGKDWVLNIAFYAALIGLAWWVAAGFRERRRRGVRGALRQRYEAGMDPTRDTPRLRWLAAGLSVLGALVFVGLGLSEPAGRVLWTGLVALGLWVPAALLLRPPSTREWERAERQVQGDLARARGEESGEG
ncbi:hypothetical protein ACIP5N_26680 [Streptomyces sp. NPDC088768]|uniref:hypothetical protein n=1 Tax=Streptomyces sp. NPDC088768 TaxID=3365894 RepID=UPI003807C0AE